MRKLFYIIFLFVFCSVISCTTTKKITDYQYFTDTVRIVEQKIDTVIKLTQAKDSIYEKDSTSFENRGDTVYITKYIYKYVQSNSAITDKSVSNSKNDSAKARVVFIDREKVKVKPYVPKWLIVAFIFSLLGAYVLGRIKG